MKNVHVLPTDKPSRLHFDNKLFLSTSPQISKNINSIVEGRNIYITSEKEIKMGDWYIIEFNGTTITKCTSEEELISIEGRNDCQKIILTTDQVLISNSVQPIDYEFLDWFVKNPSCEEVEVVYDYFQVDQNNPVLRGSTSLVKQHKIIISQEQTTEEYPNELEPVLAKISHQNDLGNPKWYEVVYYVDGKWCSYSGSKTFEDGERVVEWVHCHTIFQNTNNLITFKSEQ